MCRHEQSTARQTTANRYANVLPMQMYSRIRFTSVRMRALGIVLFPGILLPIFFHLLNSCANVSDRAFARARLHLLAVSLRRRHNLNLRAAVVTERAHDAGTKILALPAPPASLALPWYGCGDLPAPATADVPDPDRKDTGSELPSFDAGLDPEHELSQRKTRVRRKRTLMTCTSAAAAPGWRRKSRRSTFRWRRRPPRLRRPRWTSLACPSP